MNYLEHNRRSWNHGAMADSVWARPVDEATIERARADDWKVFLTPKAPVPRAWFGSLRGKDVLCLASGGGRQAPIFAAAGARVVSFDPSEEQLRAKLDAQEPVEFSHSLASQIGGQSEAGFVITGLYEDHWLDDSWLFSNLSPICIATRAMRVR